MALLNILSQFKHKGEIRESKDEILMGQLVLQMACEGWPLVGVKSDMGVQHMRFRTVDHEVLHGIQVRLDRKTGTGAVSAAIVGSKATLRVTAEVKNLMADPDDLLKQWATDFKNIAKIPLLGQVKINHEMNSIFAEKATIIDIDTFVLKGEAGDEAFEALLGGIIEELIAAVAPYKKDSVGFEDVL